MRSDLSPTSVGLPPLSAAIPFSSPDLASSGGATTTLARSLRDMVLCEFVIICIAAYVTTAAYSAFVLRIWPPSAQYLIAAAGIAGSIVILSLAFRQYSGILSAPLHRFVWHGLGAAALSFSFLLSALFLLKTSDWYSRGTFVLQFAIVGACVALIRALFHRRLQSRIAAGYVEARRAVLLGNPDAYPRVVEQLRRDGIHVVGCFPFPFSLGTPTAYGGPNWDGGRIAYACRAARPDDIVILATAEQLSSLDNLVGALSELPVSVHLIPLSVGNLLNAAQPGELGELATWRMIHPPLSSFDTIVKRSFDIATSGLGLLLLSPLLLITAVAIKLDSTGPVFFRQTRHGYNNHPIKVFKFRTMTTIEDGYNCTQAIRGDPRVTVIGRVLRRTNIDELPQLINVLMGDMSIVGPRPHPIALNTRFEKQISPFLRRHNVKPGLTGWAQVHGYRGETDTLEKMQRRVEYDLYYIDNWSFLLDIKIILMTVLSKQAYANAF
jgi:Undecaprenyl-phosphate glucose phosphotransferase